MLQRNIDTLQDALEQEMQIKAMARYPQDYKLGAPSIDPTVMGLQNQTTTLTEMIKHISPTRLV